MYNLTVRTDRNDRPIRWQSETPEFSQSGDLIVFGDARVSSGYVRNEDVRVIVNKAHFISYTSSEVPPVSVDTKTKSVLD